MTFGPSHGWGQARAVAACAALALALGCGPKKTFTNDGGPCEGTPVPEEGFQHVPFGTPVAYQHNPPASGDHWPCWTTWGVASQLVHPEAWIHNLEHGGVVLLYQCLPDAGSCDAAKTSLANIAAAAPDAPTGGHRLVVTADPDLPTPFAAVAWDWVLTSSTADEAAFVCFTAQHEGQGREDISADGLASCL